MKKNLNALILLLPLLFVHSCAKNNKQNEIDIVVHESNIEKKINIMPFIDANKLLENNALEHKYHWYQNADGTEGGLLVLDKTADMEWIKQNLSPTFSYIQSIEIKNNDLSIIPLLNNCTIAKIYNKTSEKQIDLLSFPKTYKRLTFYDYDVNNLSHLQEFNNLVLLNIDCEMKDLNNTSSDSIIELIIRNNDTFDFSVLKNFPNLSTLKIEKTFDLLNISFIADSNIKVLWIKSEDVYLKYKQEFETLKLNNNNLTIWYGNE